MKIFIMRCLKSFLSNSQTNLLRLLFLILFYTFVITLLQGCSSIHKPSLHSDAEKNYVFEKSVSRERGIMRAYLLGKLAIHSADHENRKGALNGKVAQYLGLAVPNLLLVAQETKNKTLAEQAVQAAIYSKDYALAAQATEILSHISGERGRSDYFAAIATVKKGDKEKSIVHIQSILDHSESLPQSLTDIVSILSNAPDHQFAVEIMEQVLASNQDIENFDYAYATLLSRDESTVRQAEEILLERLKVNPHDELSTLSYLQIKQKFADTFTTLEAFRQAIARFPSNIDIRQNYAGFLISKGRYPDAFSQYQILHKSLPEDVDLAFRLGVLALELKKPDAAEAYFNLVLQHNLRTNEIMYYLGRVEELRGNYKKALTNYSQVMHGEYRFDALLREAKVMSSMGSTESALASVASLQKINEDEILDIRLTLSKVDILIGVKRYADAEKTLNKAISKHAQVFDLLYARSMVREKLSNVKGAIDDLRILIKQQPNSPDVMNALGYTLVNRTDRYEEAYELISRAIKLKPDSAAVIDSMGWVLFKMGKLEQAYEHLRRAYDIHPDPEIAAHLGEVLFLIGKKQEAQLIWHQALKVDPDHEVLNEVIDQYRP